MLSEYSKIIQAEELNNYSNEKNLRQLDNWTNSRIWFFKTYTLFSKQHSLKRWTYKKKPTENKIVHLNQQGIWMDYSKTLIKDNLLKDYVDLTYDYSKNDIVIKFVHVYYLPWRKKKEKKTNWK